MHRIGLALGALALAVIGSASVPVGQLAKPPASAETWYITSMAGKHGQSQRWTDAKGVHWSRESLNLRGFVNEIDQANKLAKDGSVASLTIRGFTPTGDAAETFNTANGAYTFKSPVDSGNGKAANALYVPVGGTLDANITIAEALMHAPDHTLSLLPSPGN